MANNLVRGKMRSKAVALGPADDAIAGTAILEFQSPTLTLITAPAPFSARMTTWVIFTLVVVSFVLLSTMPIDRVVATSGVVLAQSPNVIVQPLETAIVRRIYVKEGQTVKKGDLLAELDPTFAGSDEKSSAAQRASLKAQVERMKAELSEKTYSSDGSQYGQLEEMAFIQRRQQFAFTMENYNQKVMSLESKVSSAKSDIEGFGRRLIGLRSVEAMRSELEKFQVGSKLNTLAAIDARQQIEQNMNDAKHALEGSTRDLAAMIAERDSWKHQWLGDLQTQESQQERMLSDMEGQSAKNAKRNELVMMRAEADSIVLSVARVAPGTVLQSGVQLMTTVAVDSPLEVIAPIDGADAGFVQPGDKVAIKFDTLPYFRYGYAMGHVVKLSDDSFTDPTTGGSNPTGTQPTISNQAPQYTGTAPVYYYRAQIAIDRLELRHPPESFKIKPGMPIEADIQIGRRTAMQYLFDKWLPFLGTGMREPT